MLKFVIDMVKSCFALNQQGACLSGSSKCDLDDKILNIGNTVASLLESDSI